MSAKYSLCLCFLSILLIHCIHAQSNPGFGYYIPDRSGPCITPTQHTAIEKEIKKNQDSLRTIGKLPQVTDRALTTLFAWPIAQNNGLNDFDDHAISNFVDQDTSYPNKVFDFNCGNRTYDLGSGYNHRGTDIFLWPFPWYKMEHDQVKVVAAASGTIVYKSDGNFDKNCAFNNLDWNSVDVQHADGSIAWYGHMKNGSLTNKSVGDSVVTGEYLGIVGSSGSSTAPHLHFEIYAAGNFLIDPYTGNCNSLNNESWWINQRPYYDSGLNAMRTHGAPPVFPDCPESEIPNEKDQFCIGDGVYYAAYYRDQLAGQHVIYKVMRPDNSVYLLWDQTFDAYYPASFWYWYDPLPANSPTGRWTFQTTFLGNVYEKYFDVNGSTHIVASGTTTICEGEEVTLTAPASQYGFEYQWRKNGADIPGDTSAILMVTETGIYTCAISTVNGCSTISNAMMVTVVPNPVVDLGDDIIYLNGADTVLNAEGPGFTYLWSTGETTSTITVSQDGAYSVTVTDANGCTGTDKVEIIGSSATTYGDLLEKVKIYPNPANDWLTVDFGRHETGNVSVSLIDIWGKVVWNEEEEINLFSIPVGQLAAGVYCLKIDKGMEFYTRMVVIK